MVPPVSEVLDPLVDHGIDKSANSMQLHICECNGVGTDVRNMILELEWS